MSATDIVDEYLDGERRKLNLIIFGLPDSSGKETLIVFANLLAQI